MIDFLSLPDATARLRCRYPRALLKLAAEYPERLPLVRVDGRVFFRSSDIDRWTTCRECAEREVVP